MKTESQWRPIENKIYIWLLYKGEFLLILIIKYSRFVKITNFSSCKKGLENIPERVVRRQEKEKIMERLKKLSYT